jgi:polyhydroxyalkanoate synthesis repressor PhaR
MLRHFTMAGPKTIKRYANRKLYDTERSCYVTLDDIAAMIKAGEEVRVLDNKTGEDLTSVTFAQIIFEAEKKTNFMPLSLLTNLIRSSGDAIGEFARGHVDRVQAKALEIKETAERLRQHMEERIERLIGRKGSDGKPGNAETGADAHRRILRDLLATSQKAIDEVEKGLEDRIRSGVGAVSAVANLGREMDEIRQRLANLEQRIGKIPD